MSVYYLLFGCVFLLAFIPKKNMVWGKVAALLLLFISMFRGINVGSDTINYYTNNFYDTFDIYSSRGYTFEFIFIFISNFFHSLDLPPRFCLYFLSLVTFVFLDLSSRRYRVDFASVCFFFYLFNFYFLSLNISRQIAAITILLYAYSFLKDTTPKRYYFFLYVIVAAGIHISSLLFMLVYLLTVFPYMKKNKAPVFRYLQSIGLIILYVFFQFYGTQLQDTVFSISESLMLYNKYANQTEIASISFLGLFSNIVILIIDIIIYYTIKKKGYDMVARLFLISIIVKIFFSSITGNIGRLMWDIMIIKVIAYCYCFSKSIPQMKPKELLFLLIMTFLNAYNVFYSINRGAYEIVPYYMTL